MYFLEAVSVSAGFMSPASTVSAAVFSGLVISLRLFCGKRNTRVCWSLFVNFTAGRFIFSAANLLLFFDIRKRNEKNLLNLSYLWDSSFFIFSHR